MTWRSLGMALMLGAATVVSPGCTKFNMRPLSLAAKNPDAPGVHDVAARVAHLREYAEKFQYVVTTPESRLDAERLLRIEELRLRAKELRADVEAFLREPDA